MRKSILLFLFFFTGLCSLVAQVNFSVSYRRVSPTEVHIIFTGRPSAGFHIYSTGFAEGGPTVASFTPDKAKGVELLGHLQPGSGEKTVFDPTFEMTVKQFESTATFTQRVRLTAKDYELTGYLTYGACNDQSCLPPTNVDARLKGSDGPEKAAAEAATPAAVSSEAPAVLPPDSTDIAEPIAVGTPATAVPTVAVTAADSARWWQPSIDALKSFGGSDYANMSLWYIFLLGFLGGLLALATPCVWPIIPMTVSFFLKRSGSRAKGIRDAITYGISIIVIYVGLGLLVTSLYGSDALNALSTNAAFNLFFFLMLVVFAASFFGGFEITLPSKWGDSVDSKATQTAGLLSIFLMAFTLALVSFSCTGPIIGVLLVGVSTGNSGAFAPTVGMLGFAIALALPFTLFALFPGWLKSAPKSGGWMNVVKVTLGFLELAFALKFLSVADLAYGWGILDRETFLALWIVLFGLLGVYLLGRIKFPHDDDNGRVSVPRFFLAVCSLAFAVYMVPGLWGAPLKAVSAFAPPMSTQDFVLDKQQHIEPLFKSYEEGMAYARQQGKPALLDFTGFGCVNCRKMEAAVWTDPRVRKLLTEDYVLISLYVDDKAKLSAPLEVQDNGQTSILRTVGNHWSYLQKTKFGANTQPFYVPLDNDGQPLNAAYSYDENIEQYIRFLETGLQNYRKKVIGTHSNTTL